MSCQIRRLFEHLSSSNHWRVMELQSLVKKVAAMRLKGFMLWNAKVAQILQRNLHMFDPHSLHKVWKWLCICVNEVTIDFHHVSAIKLKNSIRRNLTQRWVCWSCPVVPEVSVETQTRVTKGQKIPRRSKPKLYIFNVTAVQWCRRRVCRRCKRTPKSFDLLKIREKSLKIWAKSLKIQTKSLSI